jgi:hypothetical protein
MIEKDQRSPKPLLLAIIELGGYPNFTPIYESAGYEVLSVYSVRKALSELKRIQPAVVVAEFNYQSDFRDRTSSLESLLAVLQRVPDVRVVVFYEKEFAHQLKRLTDRFPIRHTFSFPVDENSLRQCLA